MSKQCQLTGVKRMVGNQISHSKRHTKVNRELNIKDKRYFVAKFNERVRLRLSTRAIKTIDKFGTIEEFLKRTPDAELSEVLLRLKRRIYK